MKFRCLLFAIALLLARCGNFECNTCYYNPLPLPHDTSTAPPVTVPKRDWNISTLKDSVKMVQEYKWEAKMDKRTKQITKVKLLEIFTGRYDKQGRLVEECTRDAIDTTRFHGDTYTYSYDKQGNIVVDCRSWSANYLPYLRRYIEIFDEKDDLIYNVIFDENGDTMCAYQRTYKYDQEGNRVCATVYGVEDTVATSYEYLFTYDSIVIYRYRDGILSNRDVLDTALRYTSSYYHLNGKDELEQRTRSRRLYQYDADGRLLEIKDEDSYGETITRYDKHGNVVEVLVYKHKKVCDTNHYLGLKLDSRRTRCYEYDDHGNWIRAVQTFEDAEDLRHNRIKYTICERVITYF